MNITTGTMTGKLKGVMQPTTPSGTRSENTSMPPPTLLANSPLLMWGAPAAKLDGFDRTADFALGIGNRLAVFLPDQFGQKVGVGDHQLAELEDHGLSCRVRCAGPGPARFARDGDGAVEGLAVGVVAHRALLAGRGVEDGALTAAVAGVGLAVDEMREGVHR